MLVDGAELVGGGVSERFCDTWNLRRELMKHDETKGTLHCTPRFLRIPPSPSVPSGPRPRSRRKILPGKVNIFNTFQFKSPRCKIASLVSGTASTSVEDVARSPEGEHRSGTQFDRVGCAQEKYASDKVKEKFVRDALSEIILDGEHPRDQWMSSPSTS